MSLWKGINPFKFLDDEGEKEIVVDPKLKIYRYRIVIEYEIQNKCHKKLINRYWSSYKKAKQVADNIVKTYIDDPIKRVSFFGLVLPFGLIDILDCYIEKCCISHIESKYFSDNWEQVYEEDSK